MEERKLKDNVIRAMVTEQTFRMVMAIAHKYDTSMSDVVRLCIEGNISKVEEVLRHVAEERAKIKPAF